MATVAMIPQNTSFRWTLNENTYRIAVQTGTGFLQVKSVTDGRTELEQNYMVWTIVTNPDGSMHRARVQQPPPDWFRPYAAKVTPFADFSAWYATLPQGGSTTIQPYVKPIVSKTKPLTGATDIAKMYELTRRFQISEPQYNYKQNAFLIIGETVKKVYCESDYVPEAERIPGAQDMYNHYIRVEGDPKRYTTFAEIGDCLNANGKPKMTVAYRKHTYPVANLF